MKKIISLLLVFALLALAFTACTDNTDGGGSGDGATPVTVRLAGMTGPTSIGMAKLLADDKAGTSANDYEFTLAADGAAIKTKLLQGEVDVAAIPANLASALYKATNGEIVLLAVNTLGVVSILEKGETITSFADLKGKTVYAPATAKGAIPEIVFNYFLKANDIDPATDLTVEWVPANTLASTLKTTEGAVILSPQPNATAILSSVEGAREALNLNNEWEALENGSEYITGVLVCRKAFLTANTAAVNAMLTEYEASIKYANEHPAETAATVSEFGILTIPAPMIQKAIPACNVSYIGGAAMKSAVSTYINLLFDIAPAAFGGVKPDDGFYYIAE